MIEIICGELSQAIQLVGLSEQGGRFVPSRILFAFREERNCPDSGLRDLWIASGSLVPPEALQDLVWEWFLGSGRKALSAPSGKCPVCGRKGEEGVVNLEGQCICWEHVPLYWEDLLATQAGLRWVSRRCPKCALEGVLCWEGRGCCTGCMVNEIKKLDDPKRWILIGGLAFPGRGKWELRAFLEAWRKVRACPRCESKVIRVRRLLMDFPRAKSPIFPLWELTRQDMKPEKTMLRERQLRVFTEGLLRVTLECPQCGYMDLEFPGLEASANVNSTFLDF